MSDGGTTSRGRTKPAREAEVAVTREGERTALGQHAATSRERTLELENEALKAENVGLRAEIEKLKKLALVDTLTGLGSLARYESDIDDSIRNFMRGEARDIGIIFLDLNYLKTINDMSDDKHTTGDYALKMFAAQLGHTIRHGPDTAYRPSGDEFIIITENPNRGWAERFRERFNKALGEVGLSAAMGYATIMDLESGGRGRVKDIIRRMKEERTEAAAERDEQVVAGELKRMADVRMYEDKKRGKVIRGAEMPQGMKEALERALANFRLREEHAGSIELREA